MSREQSKSTTRVHGVGHKRTKQKDTDMTRKQKAKAQKRRSKVPVMKHNLCFVSNRRAERERERMFESNSVRTVKTSR